jgi:predicted DNA-binding transcriptional regulator AlpA
MANSDDEIIPPKQTADQLNVKEDTLYRYRLTGDGPPFVRVGRGRGKIGYRQSDIDQYIKDRVRVSTSATKSPETEAA